MAARYHDNGDPGQECTFDLGKFVRVAVILSSYQMWSIGNEIPIRNSPEGPRRCIPDTNFTRNCLLKEARRLCAPPGRWIWESGRSISGMNETHTAQVTSAVPGVHDSNDPFFAPLDVAGYNYSPQQYEPDHKRVPSRIMVATESFPDQSSRYWQAVWQHTYVIGGMFTNTLNHT